MLNEEMNQFITQRKVKLYNKLIITQLQKPAIQGHENTKKKAGRLSHGMLAMIYMLPLKLSCSTRYNLLQ